MSSSTLSSSSSTAIPTSVSSSTTPNNTVLTILPIPLFKDNYAYRIADSETRTCIFVDPADPEVILKNYIKPSLLSPFSTAETRCIGIATTHHHKDHSGGNEVLSKALPNLQIIGGTEDKEKIPSLTHVLDHLDLYRFTVPRSNTTSGSNTSKDTSIRVDDTMQSIPTNIQLQAIHTPCHTKGHICYYLPSLSSVFTGDTLFSAGCGRFFEGDAKQMYTSIVTLVRTVTNGKMLQYPNLSDIKIYFGHEYTLANLHFGLSIEPDNEHIRQRIQRIEPITTTNFSNHSLPTTTMTTPSTLQDEVNTNVFIRCIFGLLSPATIEKIGCTVYAGSDENDEEGTNHRIQLLSTLRELKNKF